MEFLRRSNSLEDRIGHELYERLRARRGDLPPMPEPTAYDSERDYDDESLVQSFARRLPGARGAKEAIARRRAGHRRRPRPTKAPPAPIRMCASCHDGSDPAAPILPFREPTRLQEPGLVERIEARLAPGAKRPMPPDRPLTERERQEIRCYLDTAPGC